MQIPYNHRITSQDVQYVHVGALIDALKCSYTAAIISGPHVVDAGEFRAEGELVMVLGRMFPRIFFESMESAYGPLAFIGFWRAVGKYRQILVYGRYGLFLAASVWVSKLLQILLILEINTPLLVDLSRRRYRDGVSAKAQLLTNSACFRHLPCNQKSECA